MANIEPQEITIQNFNSDSFKLWDKTWLLLTCGDFSTRKFQFDGCCVGRVWDHVE